MRRPPSRTQGILPDVRQLNNVRRLIGNFASSCFSSMKSASPDGVCFGSLFMAAVSQIVGVALLVFQTKSIPLFSILNDLQMTIQKEFPGKQQGILFGCQ